MIACFRKIAVKFPELLSDARNDATIEEEELADFQQKLVDLLKLVNLINLAEFYI